MNSPLEKLVGNLSIEGHTKFQNLNKHFPCENERDLLLRKGVYPYDYMDSELKFSDTTLPGIQEFFNRLSEEHLSEDSYQHAKNVWQTFDMQDMGQYHDLYLKTDVLLLADVFENFRDLCLEFYHLDPAHYYTSPGLAWEAILKMTKVKLELLEDIDMVLMIEKGIRGGVSMISKKYARANNPKVPDYDTTKPNSWISYLDMNNLYGTSMVNSLPERDFDWLNDKQLENFDVNVIPDDSETGYILEVDIEYPEHLHDDHSDYPLAPENITVTNEMISPHTKMLREKLQIKSKPSAKLVPNLQHKKQYVTHYRNLKYYLSKGMVLTKIHRGIEFTQSPWMKKYIDFNTQKRSEAKNDFEKDFFKLMNNAVFGKTMENMRKRMNVELVNTKRRLRKLTSKPNFLSFKIFDEDLVAVNLKKPNIVLNRPIYAGFCILELSKIFMYQFHYEFMREKYGNRASLLFTDTDSLCYEVKTHDFYHDMMTDLDRFDTSNFEKDHFLYSKKNCKVLGKMKDENGGKVVQEFIGLKPKMYSLMCHGGDEKRTAKGIRKYVIDKYLKHEAYKTSLSNHCSLRHSMNMIRSYGHQLYSITVTKTSLSPYDDKRYVLDSGIETLAHGHYRVRSSIP
ncbi:hypothetical protein FSP39_020689 [Pinctada imbricata]|uniref:DNA-directed DNA polymerase n=1 Tax=Pinctada imbricata TaxID=66713 RepID=A0AA88XNA5_PINIB|nr:hypothetical protein FSP39_020689 [Pinctada imbricata]